MGTKFEMNNGSSFKIRGKRKATFRRSKNQDVLLRGPRPVFHPQGIFVSFKATTSKRDQGAREMVSSRLSLGHHQDGDVETIKTLPKTKPEMKSLGSRRRRRRRRRHLLRRRPAVSARRPRRKRGRWSRGRRNEATRVVSSPAPSSVPGQRGKERKKRRNKRSKTRTCSLVLDHTRVESNGLHQMVTTISNKRNKSCKKR